jgi:hypothetical protein
MENKSETIRPPEKTTVINSDLGRLLNEGLNATLGEFTRKNKGKSDSKVDGFRRNLDIIEAAVAEPDSDDPKSITYQIRQEYLNSQKDVYYIKLAQEDQIDPTRLTYNESPLLKLIPGKPATECQIAIKPFSIYSTNIGMESQRKLEKSGYSINLTASRFLLENGKVSVEPLVGIEIKLPLAGDIKAGLKTYIGKLGFKQINQTTLTEFKPDKVISYLDKLGLSDPRQN